MFTLDLFYFLATAAMAVVVVDLGLGFLFARLAARMAFVPLGVERQVELPRSAAPDARGGYRDGAGVRRVEGLGPRWRTLEACPYGTPLDGVPRPRVLAMPSVLAVQGKVIDGVLALRARSTVPMLPTLVTGAAMGAVVVMEMDLVPGWLAVVVMGGALLFNGVEMTRRSRRMQTPTARRLVDEVAARYAGAE